MLQAKMTRNQVEDMCKRLLVNPNLETFDITVEKLMSAPQPKAVVIVFPGSNGDRDLFETFEAAGFETSYVPSASP